MTDTYTSLAFPRYIIADTIIILCVPHSSSIHRLFATRGLTTFTYLIIVYSLIFVALLMISSHDDTPGVSVDGNHF